jgi:hypothetical protein
MPIIESIPERLEDGFAELSVITDKEFSFLQKALTAAKHSSSIQKLCTQIEITAGLETVDVEEILLSIGKLQTSIDSKEIIKEVVSDISEIASITEVIKEESKKKFAKRLNILLEDEKIFYAAKSDDLIHNYSNSFIQCRVVSDIRPVFGMGAESIPMAGIIIHNLTIHYDSNEEPFHRDITLTLTSQDIKNLQAVLKRAQKKDGYLKKILENSAIKDLNE